jgi:repressor of nif and glnA expression
LQQQEKANGVVYRNTEEISTIQNVAAFLDTTDPRRIFISADVTSVSGAGVNTLVPLKG